MKKVLTLLYVVLCSITVNAQSDLFEVGLFLGGSVMGGDLVESDFGSTNDLNPAYGLVVRRYFHTNIAARASAIYSKLTSIDRQYDKFGGQTFQSETTIIELTVSGEYDILGHQRNWQGNGGKISPYVHLGLGVALTDPMLTYDQQNDEVLSDQNANVSDTRFVLPFGAGVRFNFSQKGTLIFELGARPTFSDYLDGVSIAGNPAKNDWYGFGGIQLLYKLSGSNF